MRCESENHRVDAERKKTSLLEQTRGATGERQKRARRSGRIGEQAGSHGIKVINAFELFTLVHTTEAKDQKIHLLDNRVCKIIGEVVKTKIM